MRRRAYGGGGVLQVGSLLTKPYCSGVGIDVVAQPRRWSLCRLGLLLLRGIGRLDMGLATVGGVGIVILAIILDRLTQAVGRDARSRGNRRWYTTGPLGLITRPFCR